MPRTTNDTTGEPLLYHVKRTIIDLAEDKSGATRVTDIEGTYTDLSAAKTAAQHALASEGYLASDFDTLSLKTAEGSWTHGDGVLVYAKAPAGQEFEVAIDTKPNTLNLKGNAAGKVEGVLHYGMIHSHVCEDLPDNGMQLFRQPSSTTKIGQEVSSLLKSKALSQPAKPHTKPRRRSCWMMK